MTPEQTSRQQIDRQLEKAGWSVQDYRQMNITAGLGVAVREFPRTTGNADYMLYADAKAIGVVEAKPKGRTLTIPGTGHVIVLGNDNRLLTAAVAQELGLSEAIGALMAGIVLSETSVREQIEERFFSFRDIFAALFFFVFGLSIDLSAIGDVGWIVALAVVVTLVGKLAAGLVAGRLGGFTSRQSFNAGVALVAHGEFTIILAQLASENPSIDAADRTDLVAFAGLYVLVTATVGIVLMKESKRLGRRLFPTPPRLAPEGGTHGPRAP